MKSIVVLKEEKAGWVPQSLEQLKDNPRGPYFVCPAGNWLGYRLLEEASPEQRKSLLAWRRLSSTPMPEHSAMLLARRCAQGNPLLEKEVAAGLLVRPATKIHQQGSHALIFDLIGRNPISPGTHKEKLHAARAAREGQRQAREGQRQAREGQRQEFVLIVNTVLDLMDVSKADLYRQVLAKGYAHTKSHFLGSLNDSPSFIGENRTYRSGLSDSFYALIVTALDEELTKPAHAECRAVCRALLEKMQAGRDRLTQSPGRG